MFWICTFLDLSNQIWLHLTPILSPFGLPNITFFHARFQSTFLVNYRFSREFSSGLPGHSTGKGGTRKLTKKLSRKLSKELSGGSQETIWDHQHLQGLRTALNSISWCHSANAKVPFIFQFHDEFLRVGVTKYQKLQCKIVRDHHRGSHTGSKASNPTPLEPLQINLFGEW